MPTAIRYKYGFKFVAVTMLWTWSVLAVPAMLRLNFESPLTKVAYVLAGASPSVLSLLFAVLTGGGDYIRGIVKRALSLGGAKTKDLLAVFGLVPAVTVLSACAGSVLFKEALDWSQLLDRLENPMEFALFALFTLIFGPLAEELGWRGYLLDCWEDRGILVYGIGIGLIWTVWHLPMFFIAGTYQNGLLRQGALPILYFVLSTTALGVIAGRITKKTGSILAAILFHFTINFTGELIPLAPLADLFNTVVLAAIACGLVFYERKREACHGEE